MNVTMCHMGEKTYSTLEAAKKARKKGIHRATLIRWLQEGRVTTSIAVPLADGKILRRWTDADIRKLQAYCDDFYRVPNEIRDKK